MSLAALLAQLRIDLHDEDPADERWPDATLEQHITHSVAEYSRSLPLETLIDLITTPGSREIDLTPLGERICVNAVEYPRGNEPRTYERFSIWADTLTMIDAIVPTWIEKAGTNVHLTGAVIWDVISLHFTPDDVGKWAHNTTYDTWAHVTSCIPPEYLYLDLSIMADGDTYELIPENERINIYYGIPHTVDDLGAHTIPPDHNHLVLSGAAGFALVEWANYAINRVNVGGGYTAKNYLDQGLEMLAQFRKVLKALSKQNAVRIRQLYTPYQPPQSKTRVIGP